MSHVGLGHCERSWVLPNALHCEDDCRGHIGVSVPVVSSLVCHLASLAHDATDILEVVLYELLELATELHLVVEYLCAEVLICRRLVGYSPDIWLYLHSHLLGHELAKRGANSSRVNEASLVALPLV